MDIACRKFYNANKANKNVHIVDKKRVAGAQSLRRAIQLLRLVGGRHEEGISVVELAELAGLERTTVHRLVSCLAEERFLDRDPATRRFRLGLESMNLGLLSLHRAPVLAQNRAALQRVARISGDTVFLVVPQGDYAVCVHREEGPYPVKVFTIDVGERRLLGIGAGGLALLALRSDAAIAASIRRHADQYRRTGFDAARIDRLVNVTRKNGYSVTMDTITPEIGGVGIAFEISKNIWAAASIGAIRGRLDPGRRAELARLLRSEFPAGPMS